MKVAWSKKKKELNPDKFFYIIPLYIKNNSIKGKLKLEPYSDTISRGLCVFTVVLQDSLVANEYNVAYIDSKILTILILLVDDV